MSTTQASPTRREPVSSKVDQGFHSCDGKDNGTFGSPTASLGGNSDQSLQQLLDGGFDAAAEAYSVASPASSGAAVRRKSGSAWDSSDSTPVSSSGSQRSSVSSPQWHEHGLSPTQLWSSSSSEVDLGGSLAAASRRLDAVQPFALTPSDAVSTSRNALPAQDSRMLVLRSPNSRVYDSRGATRSLHAWKGTCSESASPGRRNDGEHAARSRSSASSSSAGWFSSTSSPNMSLSPANCGQQSGSVRFDGDRPMAATDGGLLLTIPQGNDLGMAEHAECDLEEICITGGPMGSPISATDCSPDHRSLFHGGQEASSAICEFPASKPQQSHIPFQRAGGR